MALARDQGRAVLIQRSTLPAGTLVEVDESQFNDTRNFPIYDPRTAQIQNDGTFYVQVEKINSKNTQNSRGKEKALFIAKKIADNGLSLSIDSIHEEEENHQKPTWRSHGFTLSPEGKITATAEHSPSIACFKCVISETLAAETGLSEKAFRLAFESFEKHHSQIKNPNVLMMVDLSKSSGEKRGVLLNLQTGRVEILFHVAHGLKSGGGPYATQFSNESNSFQTSLGAYLTARFSTESRMHGHVLKLKGLDSTNSRAFDRAILVHGAQYVSESFARQNGRVGNSWGCFTVTPKLNHELISKIQGGSLIYAYGKTENE